MLKIQDEIDLPPLGPAWAGSLMGLSISSTLINIHLTPVVGRLPAAFMLGIATSLALALLIGFLRNRVPGFHSTVMPSWGMASMGILALGSAYSGVFTAWTIHALCWGVGTVLGVVTCLRFLHFLIVTRPSGPAFTWGLPLVAPMVAATSSAQLTPHAGEWASVVHGIGVACFVLAWTTAIPTFVFVYLRTFPKLPTSFAATAWIPLGLVGQSTAGAQLLAGDKLLDGDQWHLRAAVYGAAMLSLGVPLAVYAVTKHWGAVLGSTPMSYNPSWWASTFPVGTCCLGTHALSTQGTRLSWNVEWLDTVSAALLILLLVHIAWATFGAVAITWGRARSSSS